MARTKRKINPVVNDELKTAAEAPEKVYRAAGYVRLSIEDSGKSHSDTVEGQKKIVTEYIEGQPDMSLVDIYCDNGSTGTNFSRPQFDLMMEEVRKGNIDCIVVKDLSRFGRNYKETGNYLERIFPFLGVRFVAVNDSFDTLTADRNEYGFVIPLKNLMNEMYSRDISRKVSTALEAKQRRGEFVGTNPPYGYSKSTDGSHRLVINPDTAPIVRRVFEMRKSGIGYQTIAKRLNNEGIPSPGAYQYLTGRSKRPVYQNAIWLDYAIKEMLRNEVYLGHLVQGKRTNQSYKRQRVERYAPESEWRITRNAHEAIIDEETFIACQQVAAQKLKKSNSYIGKHDDEKTENIFLDLIFCADCGTPMSRRYISSNRAKGNKYYYYSFFCRIAIMKKGICKCKNIAEEKLKEIVSDSIKKYIAAVTELEKRIRQIHSERQAHEKTETEKAVTAERRELSRLQGLYDRLYADLVDGILSREEYAALKEQYQVRIGEVNDRIANLTKQKEEQIFYSPANPLFSILEGISNGEDLSAELLKLLISRIEIGENGVVSITFNFQDEFRLLSEYAEREGSK